MNLLLPALINPYMYQFQTQSITAISNIHKFNRDTYEVMYQVR